MIDARPDTVNRTTSPSYKAGQKLLLIHEGVPVDAIVEEWLGLRRGSRHRVRLGGKGIDPKGAKAGAASGGKGKDGGKEGAKGSTSNTIEVDLSESNHSKLLYPSVARFEDARVGYCDKLLAGKHSTVKDEATAKDLRVADQRVYTKPYVSPKGKGAEDEGGKEVTEDAPVPSEGAKDKARRTKITVRLRRSTILFTAPHKKLAFAGRTSGG